MRADAMAGDGPAITLARGPWGEVRIALADVNRDGRADLVWRIATGDTAHVWIWLDRGPG
jgi:hypothetical protein